MTMPSYDREGNVMGTDDPRLYDPNYKRVAQTTLADGRWVSTVWLGLNYNWSKVELPLIFETTVFKSEDEPEDNYCARYATEEEAKRGHEEVVARAARGEL